MSQKRKDRRDKATLWRKQLALTYKVVPTSATVMFFEEAQSSANYRQSSNVLPAANGSRTQPEE
jgi:hypothetical protein